MNDYNSMSEDEVLARVEHLESRLSDELYYNSYYDYAIIEAEWHTLCYMYALDRNLV